MCISVSGGVRKVKRYTQVHIFPFCSLKYIKEPFPAFALFEVHMRMFGAILLCLTVFLVAIFFIFLNQLKSVGYVFFIQKTNESHCTSLQFY